MPSNTTRKIDNSYRTAMKRTRLSVPARKLKEMGKIVGRGLDYGCGRGMDAQILGIDKYDPFWYPATPLPPYDVVLCSYVLNVLSLRQRKLVLENLRNLIYFKGTAYITVRRDIKKMTKTKYGYQWNVKLSLPIVYKNSSFCIYEMGPIKRGQDETQKTGS